MSKKRLAPSLQEISTLSASELPLKSKTVVFPIGSNEQHGPHLPMGTDTYILNAIVEGVRRELEPEDPFVFLPSMPYGKSPEHMDFTGTASLKATTLIAILDDIVGSMQKHGVKKIVILNSHGGNTDLINSLAYDLHYNYGVGIFCLSLWSSDFMGSDEIKQVIKEVTYPDVHAASIETSMLLYLKPELVGAIPKNVLPKAPFPTISTGWATKDLSDNGIIGDLRESDKKNGEILYHLLIEKAVLKLREIAKED